ncbi:MAG: hypothetical protein FWG31_06230 [Oscillospiraceae bacterium]|nr:hypothetical protein [Oscillospiraceae bacterium]
MKIDIDNMSVSEIRQELRNGSCFIRYRFCFSLLFFTFMRSSGIYLIRDGESRAAKGLRFTVLTFLAGWWGVPWGPVYSIRSIKTNLRGGIDITENVKALVQTQEPENNEDPEKEDTLVFLKLF